MSAEPTIRPLTEADILRLAEIRPGFVSTTALRVERLGQGLEAGWRLVEYPLPQPFDKGHAYDFDANEQAAIRRRVRHGDGLHLVVEWRGRIAGLLEVTPQEWNNTAWVWNLMLDQAIRRQGIGRELFARAVTWARQAGYRALVFETQTNNVPACKFYLTLGCRLDGLRETLYHNDDLARGEVALFWAYPLVR
ncbi:MAG: GNAT family N-acetyltransferase [Anaerolineae bacterium]|nr:GNAT family N-acetyltransferase [Anaerolineae bacterium]